MIKQLMRNRVANNAGWIIGCKLIQAFLGLVISMITARYLGPNDYGVINYAQSLVTFLAPITQLGFTSTLVHELVNRPEQEGEVMGTAIMMSLCSSFICIAGLIGYTRLSSPNEPETIAVCGLYSIVLFMQSLELIQYWFQAKLLSKYSAIVTLAAYSIMCVYQLFILITRKSVGFFAVSKGLEYCIISVVLLILFRRLSGKRFHWNKRLGKELLSHSWRYMVSFLLVMTFAQADRIMIKVMIGNAAMGYYSAAVVCANLTDFVFIAIIDSMRPVILNDRLLNKQKYEERMSILYCIVIYLALIQSLFITLLAKPIIHLLYGEQYIHAVMPLQIIVWYTAFSYIGMARNVWILGEGKEKLLLLINGCGAATNVALNSLFIPYLGINGAALASLLTQMFTNWGIGYIIPDIRRNNQLIRKGLNPFLILGFLKQKQFS